MASVSSVGFGAGTAGEHVVDEGELAFEIGDGEIELLALGAHRIEPLSPGVARAAQLRELLVAEIVEVEKLADLLEAEAEALAAQDQPQARGAAAGWGWASPECWC